MVRRGWDSGLDFEEAYRRILGHMLGSRSPYDVVLLIQLRNGSRVGEAVEAVRQFCAARLCIMLRKKATRLERPRLAVVYYGECHRGAVRVGVPNRDRYLAWDHWEVYGAACPDW